MMYCEIYPGIFVLNLLFKVLESWFLSSVIVRKKMVYGRKPIPRSPDDRLNIEAITLTLMTKADLQLSTNLLYLILMNSIYPFIHCSSLLWGKVAGAAA